MSSYDDLADKELEEEKATWINADEMANEAKAPNYLINNILETKTNGLIAGSSQSFKSFCVLKMAHSICTGQDFFGHDVFTTGKVLYICGEGMGALGRRIKALTIVEGGFNDNFFVLNRPLFIDNIAEMAWLKLQINDIKPVFVIHDTFSSLATSTKENANEEVARCLRMVADCCEEVGASSIIVHHYGKVIDNGSRGASAFSANVDYEISMTRGEGFNAVMSCKKSKDGDFFDDIEILAHVVELGLIRQDGGQACSLVLKKSCDDATLTPRQEIALNAIKELFIEHGSIGLDESRIKACFNIVFANEGRDRYNMFRKIMPGLLKKKVVTERGGLYFL
jgi:hypothetical protein